MVPVPNMFKKLKDEITEKVKQSPLKFQASVQQIAQAVAPSVSNSFAEPQSVSNDHFVISEDDAVPDKLENFKDKSEAKSDDSLTTLSLSRRSSFSSVANDLFPIYESPGAFNQFQSDLESNASEVEDLFTSHQLDHISKEKLYAACRKIQARYHKYKGRYSDLVRHYKKLEQENEKAKSILSETQDKALRRIAELKEQCQLEQKAKAHLEEALRNDIEERDHLINSLNTKIGYLKDGNESGIETESLSKAHGSSDSLSSSPSDLPPAPLPVSTDTDASLKEKIKKLEELLLKSKGVITEKINTIKDLSKENAELKTQTNDLASARGEIHSLRKLVSTLQKSEEETALSFAESKRSIFLELESKETQIKKLKESLAEAVQEKTLLQEKMENLELRIKASEDSVQEAKRVKADLELQLASAENQYLSSIKEKDNQIKMLNQENSTIKEELQAKTVNLSEVCKTLEQLKETTKKEIESRALVSLSSDENSSTTQNELDLLKNTNFDKILRQNESDDFKIKNDMKSDAPEESKVLPVKELPEPQAENRYLNELKSIIELLKKELMDKENKLRHINEHSVNNSTKLNLSLEKVNQMENDFRSKRDEWLQMKGQYQKQINGHVKEEQTLKRNLEDLELKLRQEEEKGTKYNLEITNLNKKLTVAEKNLSLKNQDNAHLQDSIQCLNKKIEDQNNAYIEIENRLKETEREFESEKSSLNRQNEKFVSEFAILKQAHVSSEEELKNYKISSCNLENLVSSLKKQLETSGNEKDTESQSLRKKLAELEKNTAEVLVKVKEGDIALAEIKEKLQKSESKLQQAEQVRMESEIKLKESDKVLSEITAKLQDSESKLLQVEQVKIKSQNELKKLEEECVKYMNDHNELVNIKRILDQNNLSIKTTITDCIVDFMELSKKNSCNEDALERLNSELEIYKNREKSLKVTFLQSQNSLRICKSDILHLKEELAEALKKNNSQCTKLVNDCLNYSRKLIEDKHRNLNATNESLKNCENKLTALRSELNTNIAASKCDVDSRNSIIEAQETKFKELTSKVQKLESVLNESSEELKEKDKVIGNLKSNVNEIQGRLSSQLDKKISELEEFKLELGKANDELTRKNRDIENLKSKINEIENRFSLRLNEKESEITELKIKLDQLEKKQSNLPTEMPSSPPVVDLEEQISRLNDELQYYKLMEKKLEKETLNSRNLSAELEDAKMDYEKLENDFEKFRLESSKEKNSMTGNDSDLFDLLQREIENLECRQKEEIIEIEKRYSCLLAEKLKDYEALETKYLEQQQDHGRRLNVEVKEVIKDFKESEELQSKQLEELRLKLKETEEEASIKIQSLREEHSAELETVVKRWKEFLDKKVIESEQKHSNEVAALTKEWNHERKTTCEILSPSNALRNNQELEKLANSYGGERENLESLIIQVKALKKELAEEKNLHRLEVQELRNLLSKRNASKPSKAANDTDLEDCTEMEYLRNVLYEYMMGKEPMILARVLAAIVKFDAEQTNKVLQKEEQKFTLMGQFFSDGSS